MVSFLLCILVLPLYSMELSSSLHSAAELNDCKTIEKLLRNGADINATNQEGDTALSIAAMEGSLEATQLLLTYRPVLNSINNLGFTPLYNAVIYNRTLIVENLLRVKANPNIKAIGKLSPLHIAALTGSYHIVILLINHGATLNAKNNAGQNALAYIIEEIVTKKIYKQDHLYTRAYILIAAGSHITNAFRNIHLTDLMDYTMDKLRILAGDSTAWLDVPRNLKGNQQDVVEATALMYAAAKADLDAVKNQLDAGTDTLLEDNYGRNVFRIIEIILHNKKDLSLSPEKQKTYTTISNTCHNALRHLITNLVCIYKKPHAYFNTLPLDTLKSIIILIVVSKNSPITKNQIVALKSLP